MTTQRTRIAVAIVGIVIATGSLTGCGRVLAGGSQAPAAGVPAATSPATAPPASGSNEESLQGIQDDLDSADSATTNAGGDVSDADSATATNDSP